MPTRLYSSPTIAGLLGPLLGLLAWASCSADLHHDLDETQANESMVALTRYGIDAEKRREGANGWTISVPRADQERAWTVMRSRGLPRRTKDEGLEARGLLPSPGEEHDRLWAARGGRLEESFRSMAGVVDARVHLNVPRPPKLELPGTEGPRPRASVLLILEEDADLDPSQATAMVVGAVDRLQAADVQVIVSKAPGVPGPDSRPYADLGPFQVAPHSLLGLRALLGALTLSVVLLSCAVVVALIRRQRQRVQVPHR